MSLAIISHPDCRLHDPGPGHPEQFARISTTQDALKRYHFKPAATFYTAPTATRSHLIQAHSESYVDWIFSISPKEGQVSIDADTIMGPETLSAALHAAGSVILAVDLVMQHKQKVAFCNVRPPGHHAEREKAMGFCFFNNVAVGVRHAINQYHVKKIAIIDFDVHHGNGTQDIFQFDKNIMYCSSFEHPLFPGYEPEMDSSHVISVPLDANTAGPLFREKVSAAWFDRLSAFQPELIFFSAGFDAHVADPLGNLALTVEDFVWLTEQIGKIAKVYTEGRMISVLEGGYNLKALAECVPAHVNALTV